MGVDESGQQRRVAEVDGARPGRHVDGARRADGDDAVVSHDDDAVLNGRGAGAVDHAGGLEDDGTGSLDRIRRCLSEDRRRKSQSDYENGAHHSDSWGKALVTVSWNWLLQDELPREALASRGSHSAATSSS